MNSVRLVVEIPKATYEAIKESNPFDAVYKALLKMVYH